MLLILLGVAHATPIRTDRGWITGSIEKGVRVYKGIPYAAPPLGARRWKAPQPVAAWRGVRACTQFGPSCPQPPSLMGDVGRQSEDCLYLNVWAPRDAAVHPVMVWIHGGAQVIGSGSMDLYNGADLARHGVVLVTINYRLGLFGFFAHPALTQESGDSGNYGLLDQIAALRWVQRNIRAFGGDPHQVTVFGESAGAVSVAALMESPLARGLFARAIAESGTAEFVTASRADQEAHGVELAAALGTDGSLSALRALPAAKLVAACPIFPLTATARFVWGGKALPQPPRQAFATGHVTRVPLLLGTNENEGMLFGDFGVHDPADYHRHLDAYCAPYQAEAEALFPLHDGEPIAAAVARFTTVTLFTAPARRVARELSASVYLYEFTRDSATHTAEIPYVFSHEGPMQHAWLQFARSGRPGWPAYTAANDACEIFGDTVHLGHAPFAPQCDLIDKVGSTRIEP